MGPGVRGQGRQPAGRPESKEQVTFALVWGSIVALGHPSTQGNSMARAGTRHVSRMVNKGRSQSGFRSQGVRGRAFSFSRYSLRVYCRPGRVRVLSVSGLSGC